MTVTNDTSNYIGLVRLRIFDNVDSDALFQDEVITNVFNALERQNIKRTSAFFLETIATRQALIQKVIKNLNLSTDGAKLATELRTQAKDLRDQADIEDTFTNGNTGWDWAEQIFDPFTERERIINEITRQFGA